MSEASSGKKWAKFLIRWTIAIVGIGWVLWKTPLYNSVLIVEPPQNVPVKVRLAQETIPEKFAEVQIIDPATKQVRAVPRSELVNAPDTKHVNVRDADGLHRRTLLALKLSDDLKTVESFLIEGPDGHGEWIPPSRVEKYELGVPYPLIDQGILPMVRRADHRYLWAAVAIFPLTFLITGLRWHLLLTAVGINIGVARAFVINMVGAFWNTFLIGSTGGDVAKMYYAAKLAPDHRTRAVTSVVVDRAIGLLALIILGGAMAAYLAMSPHQVGDAVAQRCAQIAIGAIVIIAGACIGLAVLTIPALRRMTGIDLIIRRLPPKWGERAGKAIHTMELYRQRPGLVLLTLIMTFPVHITVIFSAMCAGMALGLPLTPGYYWVVVPVVVLAGAIPISPQGAGVMEFFAILLTRKQGCTVSQAFALTMSIRLVQMLWNLAGGIFVAKGGYHAPTEKEAEEIEQSDDEPPTQLKQEIVAQP